MRRVSIKFLKKFGILMSTAWLLTVALTSCKQIENDLESNPASNQQNIETQEATKKGLPRKDSVLSGNHSLIRTDEENIVSVAIENDKASIHFEREKWNEVRGLSYGEDIYFIPETMPDAFYPIQVEEGNIVDACIAKIPSLETNISDEDYIIPVVVLLKDNDSIEWFYANPNAVFIPDGDEEPNYIVTTFGELPYRDHFKSLSYESSGEGVGEKTIYITNDLGVRFDFLYMYLEEQLQYGIWVCEFPGESVRGYLSIDRDGGALFRVGNGKSVGLYLEDNYELWEGSINYVKSPDQYLPPGVLEFDLELMVHWYDEGYHMPSEIHGSYRAEITLTQDGMLRLYHNDGDQLYPSTDNSVLTFELLPDMFYFDDDNEEPDWDYYAFIRFDKMGSDGYPQFSIDYIEWMNDENEANGYLIENVEIEWERLKVDDDTECFIWNYDTMEREELNIFDFAKRLKNRELYEYDDGLVLVRIEVEEDMVTYIGQVYTP